MEQQKKYTTMAEQELELHPGYWDCECEENYIHSKSQEKCNKCGAHRADQPDSRLTEVQKMHETKKAENMAEREFDVIRARNEAILASMHRQKREHDHVDPDIVCQDLWEDEDFVKALDEVTRQAVTQFDDQVDTEIDQERRAIWSEEKHKKKLHAEFNAGIRNELAGMGADFYNKHK